MSELDTKFLVNRAELRRQSTRPITPRQFGGNDVGDRLRPLDLSCLCEGGRQEDVEIVDLPARIVVIQY